MVAVEVSADGVRWRSVSNVSPAKPTPGVLRTVLRPPSQPTRYRALIGPAVVIASTPPTPWEKPVNSVSSSALPLSSVNCSTGSGRSATARSADVGVGHGRIEG